MDIHIRRLGYDSDKTLGFYTATALYGEVRFSGFTVERAWLDNKPYVSCIPEGTYEGFVRTDGKNGECIELKDVPGRTFIQLHVANFPKELNGCIAPGLKRIEGGVGDSGLAMAQLMRYAHIADFITVRVTSMADAPERETEPGTVEPENIPTEAPPVPPEWLEPVETPKAMANLLACVRKDLRKSKRLRIIKSIVAGVIEVAGEMFPAIKTVTNLIPLKKKETNMTDIDVGKKVQKIVTADGWEAVVWGVVAALAVGASVFTGETALLAGAGAVGIKMGFQWYKAKAAAEEK